MAQLETKYLLFKGIAKKEQILFKSFLNLAKNELPFQVLIEKEKENFDFLIVDETYEWLPEESDFKGYPMLLIGDDMENQHSNYLTRPVQWSDFKTALVELDLTKVVELKPVEEEALEEVEQEEPELLVVELDADSDVKQVESLSPAKEVEADVSSLPAMDLAIEPEPGLPMSAADPESDMSGGKAYEFELANMSIDYKSVTNSEYERAAEDVKQFDEEGEQEAEPVLLVADEESSFNSSVLVLETNLSDEWDVNSEMEDDEAFSEAESEIEERQGIALTESEKFWLEDHEIIVDNKSLFYIKTQRDMVYSPKEPGHWTDAFLHGSFSKLPMKQEWRPFKGLKPYPTVYVDWAYTYAKKRSKLSSGLSEKEAYLLEQWPDFELLELDNNLLKLCSLMFVKPETLTSLVNKSKCSREEVTGFMNACHLMGLITTMDQMQIIKPPSSEDESMFGKIKDVFK